MSVAQLLRRRREAVRAPSAENDAGRAPCGSLPAPASEARGHIAERLRAAKERLLGAAVLPGEPKTYSVRQLALLKMGGVVLLCALYHYMGLYIGTQTAEDKYRKQIAYLQNESKRVTERASAFWFEQTLTRYEMESQKTAQWMMGDPALGLNELPALIERHDYLLNLQRGLTLKLLGEKQYYALVNRASWSEYLTPKEAWEAFADDPRRGLLPFYWYVREHWGAIEFVVAGPYLTHGADRKLAQHFVSWYLPFMDGLDRERIVRRILTVLFNPSALKRTDNMRVAAMMFLNESNALPGWRVFFDGETSQSKILFNGAACGDLYPGGGRGRWDLNSAGTLNFTLTEKRPVPNFGDLEIVVSGTVRLAMLGSEEKCATAVEFYASHRVELGTYYKNSPEGESERLMGLLKHSLDMPPVEAQRTR
jgi:hypothetical protein